MPLITGDEERTQWFARRLFEEGPFAPAIVYPTVARGRGRVRTIVTADHTDEDLTEALETLRRVGRELGLVADADGAVTPPPARDASPR